MQKVQAVRDADHKGRECAKARRGREAIQSAYAALPKVRRSDVGRA